MDHPLLLETHDSLRQRVIRFLADGCRIKEAGNIVFICGGNRKGHMRKRFQAYCKRKRLDFVLFEPEFALNDYKSRIQTVPFDIAKFEEVIGDLSFAILIFPEAPGSFAETGYFSLVEGLSRKTLLVLDQRRQRNHSFISLGPAKRFHENSIFGAALQLSYKDSSGFSTIVERLIEELPRTPALVDFDVKTFGALSNFQRFCLVYKCVEVLRIATFNDVVRILNGIFRNRGVERALVSQIFAILAGSKFIKKVGSFGHYQSARVDTLLVPRQQDLQTELLSEVMSLAMRANADFKNIFLRA